MLTDWLSVELTTPPLGTFSTWRVSEISGVESQAVDHLAPAISEHLISPELLALARDKLPPSTLKAFIDSRLPKTTILRRGVLGEVVAVRILEDVHGHSIPVKKLQYRTASHDSPKATDVLAIKVNNENIITEVAYVEAKFRSTRSGIEDLAVVAHNQLQNDCDEDIPAIIGFAAQVLKSRNDSLAEPVMAYLRDRSSREIDSHHIFLVADASCW